MPRSAKLYYLERLLREIKLVKSSHNIINFQSLERSDLFIDAIYESGPWKNIKSDPLNKLLGCGNAGGFRSLGSIKEKKVKLMVLTSSLGDINWPDSMDTERGIFTYYGDNKTPGKALHNTPRSGNFFLKDIFQKLHCGERENIPPVFIFTKAAPKLSQKFCGLVVPGVLGVTESEDLIAVWRSIQGQRFQNYRALFTVLDVPVISRSWIDDIISGNPVTRNAPHAWIAWLKKGIYKPLCAPSVTLVRSKAEQLPSSKKDKELLQILVNFFKRHPDKEYAFEACAVQIAKLIDQNIVDWKITRQSRDGGRDAVGRYRIGNDTGVPIHVDFSLEAKCWSQGGCGVKETSRLISRLRHRQFGIFVTTSYVDKSAYKEIIEDKHPVLIISGLDICKAFLSVGISTFEKL